MTFFGAEVKAGAISWIDASPECHVQLTNACLLKRAQKKNARIVLEVCEPQEEGEPPLRVALAVLSASGMENVSLNVLLTARIGLRIAGDGTDGAVVHVVGNELMPPEEYEEEEDEMEFPSDMVDIMITQDSNEEGDEDDGEDENSDDDDEPLSEESPETKKRRKSSGNEDQGGGKLVVRPKAGKTGTGGLPIVAHRSGLRFQDIILGSGKKVVKGHNVALSYVLRLENGKIIDRADRKRPFKFRLGIGECVKGFDIGVMGMREGGERHLIVPPELGYGNQSPPGIPRNSTLYFDVVVIKAF